MASAEAARTHQVAKASWMLRQSDILGRWKPSFCVQYKDGRFIFYKDENRSQEQGNVNITKSCYAIYVGEEVKSTTPPQGKDKSCLLELRTHSANITFCTDSIDDGQTWRTAIWEVKNANTRPSQFQATGPPAMGVAPPPYAPQYQAVAPPTYSVTPVVAPPAQQVVINPAGSSTTYTTYQVPGSSYVVPPANQTVVYRGGSVIQTQRAYPVQNTMYTYPGQMYTTYTYQQPLRTTGNTTVVYHHQ